MSDFPRDRYDAFEFLRKFDATPIGRDGKAVCIAFHIRNWDTEDLIRIYFPGCKTDPPLELLELARQTCMRITQLDNLVQDVIANDWQRSGLPFSDHEMHLAHISVEPTLVSLGYYGTNVNNAWTAEFKPSADEHWTKLNF